MSGEDTRQLVKLSGRSCSAVLANGSSVNLLRGIEREMDGVFWGIICTREGVETKLAVSDEAMEALVQMYAHLATPQAIEAGTAEGEI